MAFFIHHSIIPTEKMIKNPGIPGIIFSDSGRLFFIAIFFTVFLRDWRYDVFVNESRRKS
jgi:hypothetical protein